MAKKAQKYFEGIGRRKSSVARVRIYEDNEKVGIMVNAKPVNEYFPIAELQTAVTAPLRATGNDKNLRVNIHTGGGGVRAQAEAAQLGISRALVKLNSEFHKTLRDLDYLKRDPRKKERKKPGLKKARRAPQWAKR